MSCTGEVIRNEVAGRLATTTVLVAVLSSAAASCQTTILPAARTALSMAIARQALVDIGYGTAGMPNCNLVPAPELFASDNTGCIKQDMAGAKALLDKAGWVPGADGIRVKDGKVCEHWDVIQAIPGDSSNPNGTF